MKRNLQEGRKIRGTQIIYEGNGFAKVMKGGKLVERVQLEKGDNLLESLKALTEGRSQFVKDSEDPNSPGYYETNDELVTLSVFDFEGDPELVLVEDGNFVWSASCKTLDDVMTVGDYLSSIPASRLLSGKDAKNHKLVTKVKML